MPLVPVFICLSNNNNNTIYKIHIWSFEIYLPIHMYIQTWIQWNNISIRNLLVLLSIFKEPTSYSIFYLTL